MKPFMFSDTSTNDAPIHSSDNQPRLDQTWFEPEQAEAIEKYVRDMIAFSTMHLTELFEPRQIMLKR